MNDSRQAARRCARRRREQHLLVWIVEAFAVDVDTSGKARTAAFTNGAASGLR